MVRRVFWRAMRAYQRAQNSFSSSRVSWHCLQRCQTLACSDQLLKALRNMKSSLHISVCALAVLPLHPGQYQPIEQIDLLPLLLCLQGNCPADSCTFTCLPPCCRVLQATRVSAFSSRAPAAANLAAAARPTRLTRQRCVVASASGDVPPNVAEARAWIAAWKAKQQGSAAAAPAAAEVATAGSNGKGSGRRRKSTGTGKAAAEAAAPAAVAEAAAPAAKPANKMAATALKDGTLVFTADQLKSIDYTDVMKK